MAYFRCGQGGGSSLTIQISTTSESLYGQTITISKNGSTVGTTTFDNTGNAEYTVDEAGTYTVSATVSGTTYSDTVEVTDTFEASIEAGFNYHTWLAEGDVSDTYSDLAEVLADELAVRKLMTIHDAVDYLANFTDTDTSVVAILNNDYCAKWISLTDYAMDVLEAAYGTLMGTIGKYGYGEWALLPQVPTMTDNTTPSGECIANSEYGVRKAYKVFDRINSTFHSTAGSATIADYYLGYKFPTAKMVKAATILANSYGANYYYDVALYAGNSLNDLTKISNTVRIQGAEGTETTKAFTITNNTAYTTYVIKIEDSNASSTNGSLFALYTYEIQFYAWSAKGCVPIMTSNTAPYGEASAGKASTYAYKMFDGDETTCWTNRSASTTSTSDYVQYKFATPICVKRIHLFGDNDSSTVPTTTTVLTVKGSNDGTNFTDIGDVNFETVGAVATDNVWEISNDNYYLYYRLEVKTTVSNVYMLIFTLQFYGRELKVSVPTMTGNTSPYGEASLSPAQASGSEAYKAFDGSTSTYAGFQTNTTDGYLTYKFASPTAVRAYIYNVSFPASTDITLQISHSDDGTNFTDISGTQSYPSADNGTTKYFEIANNGAHLYWRINAKLSVAKGRMAYTAQFYGFDYSEREWDTSHPRRYLYEHGLAFEDITYTDNSHNDGENLSIEVTSADYGNTRIPSALIDFTSYNLVRARMGMVSSAGITIRADITEDFATVAAWSAFNNGNTDLPNNLYLDVSSVNQNAAVTLDTWKNNAGAGNKCQITELWLE